MSHKRANLGRSIESHTKKMKKLHIEMEMILHQGKSNIFLNGQQLIDQGNSKDVHQLQNACIAAREAGELLLKFASLLESRRKVIMAQNEVSFQICIHICLIVVVFSPVIHWPI